jgi:hypothetical protein
VKALSIEQPGILARGLLFGEDKVPLIRDKVSSPRYSRVWAEISATASAAVEAKGLLFPGDTLSVWYYVRTRLMDLALYVLVSGEAAAAETLNIILLDLCKRDMDFWQGPHYPNRPRTIMYHNEEVLAGELETAQLAMGIALACDWGWSYLSEETRRVVLQTLQEKPAMLLRNSIGFQSEKWVMNHLCVLSAGLVLVSLLRGGEASGADLGLSKRGLELWMEKIEADGSYGESYHYWAYPVNCLAFGILALKHCLGEDLKGAARVGKSLSWAINNQVGKYEIQGFKEPVAASVNNYDCPFIFQMEAPELLLFSSYFHLPLAQWYINNFLPEAPPRPDCVHHHWHKSNSMFLALDDETLPAASPEDLRMEPASYYADTGFVYIRDSWKNCAGLGGDTVLALQSGGGGRSCSHEHYDKNSYSLYAQGEYFICDPGHSCYRGESHRDYDTRTCAHNTLCIDRQDQTLSFLEKGMLHDEAKKCTSYNNQAVITGKNFQKDITYIASDARRSYTPALKFFTRRIWYVRPDFFLIWDRIDASNYSKEALNGFNVNNYDGKTGFEFNPKGLLISRPRASLQVHYIYPEKIDFRKEEAKLHLAYHIFPNQQVEGRFGSAVRLTPIPQSGALNKTDYISVLRPLCGGSEPVRIHLAAAEIREDLLGHFDFTVTVHGRRHRFYLKDEDVHYEGPENRLYTF